jgi:hypothetical protein
VVKDFYQGYFYKFKFLPVLGITTIVNWLKPEQWCDKLDKARTENNDAVYV